MKIIKGVTIILSLAIGLYIINTWALTRPQYGTLKTEFEGILKNPITDTEIRRANDIIKIVSGSTTYASQASIMRTQLTDKQNQQTVQALEQKIKKGEISDQTAHQINQLEEAIENLKSEHKTALSNAIELTEKITQQELALTQADQKNALLVQEKQALSQELALQKSQDDSRDQASTQKLQESVRALTMQTEKQTKEINALKQENEQLKESIVQKYQEAATQFEKELESLKKENTQLRAQKGSISQQDYNKLQQENAQLKRENEDWTTHLEAGYIRKIREMGAQREEEIEQVKQDVADELESLQKENRNLSDTVHEQAEKLKTYTPQSKDQEERLNALSKSNSELQQQLKELQKEKGSYQTTAERLTYENKELTSKISDLEKQKPISEEMQKLKTENKKLLTEIEFNKKRVNDLMIEKALIETEAQELEQCQKTLHRIKKGANVLEVSGGWAGLATTPYQAYKDYIKPPLDNQPWPDTAKSNLDEANKRPDRPYK